MADPATDPFWDDPRTAALIDLALAEDLGAGDRTSEALVPPGTPARGRLAAKERLSLNLLQHLCGIATLTRACVDRVRGTQLVVRDTRKTLPGFRLLAKYAVRTGGGTNHRLALDDAILIK